MRERWPPYPHTICRSVTVAEQVIAVCPFRRLDATHCFARGNYRAPAHIQEMRDQRFNILHRVFFDGGSGQRVIRLIISFRHIVETLLYNPETLLHFFYPYDRTVKAIAILCDGNIKVE